MKHPPIWKNPDIWQIVTPVDTNSYRKALDAKHCLIYFDNCYIFDDVTVTRCYQCNGYNRTKKFRKKRLICLRWGDAHEVKACTTIVLKDINASAADTKLSLSSDDA